jgi:hypothetical protein
MMGPSALWPRLLAEAAASAFFSDETTDLWIPDFDGAQRAVNVNYFIPDEVDLQDGVHGGHHGTSDGLFGLRCIRILRWAA